MLLVLLSELLARPPGPPPAREHTATQSDGVQLVDADQEPPVASEVEVLVRGDRRIIRSNGVPAHRVGRFPNRGNPHRITSQVHSWSVPASPERAPRPTELELGPFGVAVNGVPFDPGAAEFFEGRRGTEWRYEALSGAVPLGVDANHAHVQPTGAYHYHGLPTGLVQELGSPALVGWAADGFPIYVDPSLDSSWVLKEGPRPSGPGQPGGVYDGTFVADYELGEGELDACNGMETEQGYAYFLTESWPVIPRCWTGTPDGSFRRRPGPPR